MTLIAFHGKQSIKDEYLARVRAHKAADEIIKGVYWEKGKGCAVGCTVHIGKRKIELFARQLIPDWTTWGDEIGLNEA